MTQLITFILNHWLLCTALVVVLFLLFATEFQDKKNRPAGVSPQTTVHLINEDAAVIIDIRSQDAFEKGHIIDAIHCSETDLQQAKYEKYKTNPIVLVANQDMEAVKAATGLRTKGFAKLFILSGGIAAWRNADLPLVKGKA